MDMLEISKKYAKEGEEVFYKFLILSAVDDMIKNLKNDDNISINIEYIMMHDKFLIQYRRTGHQIDLKIAKVFRRAGHKIYRLLLKQGLSNKSEKFLNVV